MKHVPAHALFGWTPDAFDPRYEHCGKTGCKEVRRSGAPLPVPPPKPKRKDKK